VESVVLPGSGTITDINRISNTEIRIIIPQSVDSGKIVLNAGNTKITSITSLTIDETRKITGFTPSTAKAGDVITIKGEYLDYVEAIFFQTKVIVLTNNFVSQSREAIEVKVPLNAESGKIGIAYKSDLTTAAPLQPGDTVKVIVVYSEDTLNVVLPSVNQVLTLANAKPNDVITVQGKDFDLVQEVQLPGGVSVPFTIKNNNNTLAFTLPSGTKDGAITMISYSVMAITIANLTMAVPTSLVVSPATGIKSGDVISVKGTNMDVVTDVLFPGVATAVKPSSVSATEITLTVPTGTTSGNLTLNTASGKKATVAITTLKPAVTSYDPSSVPAGNVVTMTGQNLDLVDSVSFSVNKTVKATAISATSIQVTVPVDAETGVVTLFMTNGEKVTGPSLTVTKPDCCYIPVLPGPDQIILAGNILTVDIQNGNKLTGVQVNGANTQYILQNSSLSILIPLSADGNTTLKLISSNGDISYTIFVTNPAGLPPLTSAIYADGYQNGWYYGWWLKGAPDPNNTDFVRIGCVKSMKATFDGNWSGAVFMTSGVTVPSSCTKFELSVFGGPGTDGIKLQVNLNGGAQAVFTVTEGKWIDYSFPLTTWSSPTSATQMQIQDQGTGGVVYFDRIGFK
jgi:hypothetical protein